MSPQHMELPHDLALSLGSAPHSPHIEIGAVGGTSIVADDNETASIMNELPPHCFGKTILSLCILWLMIIIGMWLMPLASQYLLLVLYNVQA